MAEIHLKFDTKKKKATATVDGKKVDNLHELHLYKTRADMGDGGADSDDGAYACSMATMKHDTDHKMHHITRLHASEKSGATASETFPELFEEKAEAAEAVEPQTEVEKEIAEFLKG